MVYYLSSKGSSIRNIKVYACKMGKRLYKPPIMVVYRFHFTADSHFFVLKGVLYV